MLLPLAVVAALGAVGAAALLRPSWWWLAALLILDIAWLLVNGPVEGRTLVVITQDHGVTVADLFVPLTVPVLLRGGWILTRGTAHTDRNTA